MESSTPNRTAASRTGRFHLLCADSPARQNARQWPQVVHRPERRLGNAVLLTHDGYGHESRADPSTCVMQALGRYFTGLSTPARGTICPSDRGPFDPAFGQPAASR